MSKKDWIFIKAFFLLLLVPFSPLLTRPFKTFGNFGDLYSYHYPLRHLVVSTLQEGRLPLWNPYIFAGTPLAANPQSVLFYPGSLLHYFFPLSWAFSLEAFFHLFLAFLGAYLLLKKWGLEPAGAWTLSVSYGLSPFLVYRLAQGVPTHLAALSWAPWIWLLADSKVPFMALALSLQILSGHPQFALINLLGLFIASAIKKPSRLIPLFQAASLAVFLVSVQFIPTWEFLAHSLRAHWSSLYSLGYSLKPAYLLSFLSPSFLGNPFQKDFALLPSEFFEMLTGYIGIVPLGLGLLGLLSLKSKTAPALAAAGLFFALGENNPLYLFIQKFLWLDFLRVPSRFSFLFLLALWIAAYSGWKAFCAQKPAGFKAALALLAALDLFFWSGPWIYAQNPAQFLSSDPETLKFLRQRPEYRIATSVEIPAPNKAMMHRLYNATGYEAFYLAPIALYTARSEGAPSADGSRTYIRNWLTPEMSKLSVRYYLSPRPIPGRRPVFQKGSTYLYENPKALPLLQGPAQWKILSPEHWVIETKRGSGLAVRGSLTNNHRPPTTDLVVSQAYYPGWAAWTDGKKLGLKIRDNLFLSPEPDARDADRPVHLRFLPGSWFMGLLLSLGAGFWMIFSWRKGAFA